jgi:hypothetical protein
MPGPPRNASDPAQSDQTARLLHRLDLQLRISMTNRPAHTLDIVPLPQAATALPRQLAQRCFGDANLVYDVTRRLTEPGILSVGDALDGAPPGFAKPPGETLASFIATRGHGVIVFDDLQAFPRRAIDTLAQIADTGRACAEGSASASLRADRFAILAFARMAMPSPRALQQRAGRTAPWRLDDEVPAAFAEVLEAVAREQYGDHFDTWVTGRFEGLEGGFAWDRYRQRVADGDLDTPIFDAPQGLPRMARPAAPALRDQVPDMGAIPAGAAPTAPLDVFISYSWTRNAPDAQWLRDRLRAQGLSVFFDKDHLDVSRVPDDAVKHTLIAQLSATVAACRAWIVFAAALKPFDLPPGVDRAEALRRGLAMEIDNEVLVQWNWQRLEMRHMGRRLVIGEHKAYIVDADGSVDASFGYRSVDAREDIAAHVASYLGA